LPLRKTEPDRSQQKETVTAFVVIAMRDIAQLQRIQRAALAGLGRGFAAGHVLRHGIDACRRHTRQIGTRNIHQQHFQRRDDIHKHQRKAAHHGALLGRIADQEKQHQADEGKDQKIAPAGRCREDRHATGAQTTHTFDRHMQQVALKQFALAPVQTQLLGTAGHGLEMAEHHILFFGGAFQIADRFQMRQMVAQRTQPQYCQGHQKHLPGQQHHINQATDHHHRIGQDRRQADKEFRHLGAVFSQRRLNARRTDFFDMAVIGADHAGRNIAPHIRLCALVEPLERNVRQHVTAHQQQHRGRELPGRLGPGRRIRTQGRVDLDHHQHGTNAARDARRGRQQK